MKRTIIAVIVVLVLVGAVAAVYKYNQPHQDAQSKTADATLPADKLYTSFRDNEAAANTSYLNKVIVTSGTVDQVVPSGQHTIVVLSSGDPMGGVSCKFSSAATGAIQKGTAIKVKGICSGYLSDVNLVDCVIVE